MWGAIRIQRAGGSQSASEQLDRALAAGPSPLKDQRLWLYGY